jgi:hypothetical protein
VTNASNSVTKSTMSAWPGTSDLTTSVGSGVWGRWEASSGLMLRCPKSGVDQNWRPGPLWPLG